jgi:hypothetical protein
MIDPALVAESILFLFAWDDATAGAGFARLRSLYQ